MKFCVNINIPGSDTLNSLSAFYCRPSLSGDIIKDTIYFLPLQLPQSHWPDSRNMNEKGSNCVWKIDTYQTNPQNIRKFYLLWAIQVCMMLIFNKCHSVLAASDIQWDKCQRRIRSRPRYWWYQINIECWMDGVF